MVSIVLGGLSTAASILMKKVRDGFADGRENDEEYDMIATENHKIESHFKSGHTAKLRTAGTLLTSSKTIIQTITVSEHNGETQVEINSELLSKAHTKLHDAYKSAHECFSTKRILKLSERIEALRIMLSVQLLEHYSAEGDQFIRLISDCLEVAFNDKQMKRLLKSRGAPTWYCAKPRCEEFDDLENVLENTLIQITKKMGNNYSATYSKLYNYAPETAQYMRQKFLMDIIISKWQDDAGILQNKAIKKEETINKEGTNEIETITNEDSSDSMWDFLEEHGGKILAAGVGLAVGAYVATQLCQEDSDNHGENDTNLIKVNQIHQDDNNNEGNSEIKSIEENV